MTKALKKFMLTLGPAPIVYVNLIPLNRAVLCSDCDHLSDSRGRCGACGSTAVLALSRLIQTMPEPPVRVKCHTAGGNDHPEAFYRPAQRAYCLSLNNR